MSILRLTNEKERRPSVDISAWAIRKNELPCSAYGSFIYIKKNVSYAMNILRFFCSQKRINLKANADLCSVLLTNIEDKCQSISYTSSWNGSFNSCKYLTACCTSFMSCSLSSSTVLKDYLFGRSSALWSSSSSWFRSSLLKQATSKAAQWEIAHLANVSATSLDLY